MSDVLICPHCGRAFELNDPRVRRLTPAQFAIWHSIERRIRREPMGVTAIASLADISPSLASYHVRRLRGAGLVTAIPKRKGGSYKVYKAAA